MSVRSSSIFPGGARLDTFQLRLIDAYTRGDFDLLAGLILAGGRPLVLRGFTLATFQTGGLPKLLNLVVRDGVAVHPGATASGTIFQVPPDREIEVLDPATNPRVSGSYGGGRANYVGLDIVRGVDVNSKEQLAFWQPQIEAERYARVPLAKTQDYRIVITDVPFEQTTLLPLWIVITDSSGAVSELRDARPFFGSLGTGGTDPDPHRAFEWPQGRTLVAVDRGGDKGIFSVKDASDAVMTRIREIGGGEFWYSQVSDRNVKMVRSGTTFSNGEYLEWTGTNLHWRGLAFLLPSSTGTVNEIADQTSDSAGLTNLADGECIYVDLDYSADHTGGSALAAGKVPRQNLGTAARDRSRTVIAWRRGSYIFTRDGVFPVNAEPFPALRDAINSEVVARRIRMSCTSSPTINIEAFGSILIDRGNGWESIAFTSDLAINSNTTISGGLVANTRYYVYAGTTVGTLTGISINTTAPDASLHFENGTTNRVYLGSFCTVSGAATVLKFRQGHGQNHYLEPMQASGGSKIVTAGGNGNPATTTSYGVLIPSFARQTGFRMELAGTIFTTVKFRSSGAGTDWHELKFDPTTSLYQHLIPAVPRGTTSAFIYYITPDAGGGGDCAVDLWVLDYCF